MAVTSRMHSLSKRPQQGMIRFTLISEVLNEQIAKKMA